MSHNPVPLIPLPQAITRDAEIDQIKRELNVLRARYTQYGRMGQLWKVFSIVTAPPITIGALAVAIRQSLVDVLSGVFLIGILVICAALMIWLIYAFEIRWIDVASSRVIYPERGAWWKSDARLLEEQITEREHRLSELEGTAS